MSRDVQPRECPVCHGSYVPTRRDQEVCGPTCRQRKRRGTYVLTAEDRALLERMKAEMRAELDLLLGPPKTPEQILAHVIATAVREGE